MCFDMDWRLDCRHNECATNEIVKRILGLFWHSTPERRKIRPNADEDLNCSPTAAYAPPPRSRMCLIQEERQQRPIDFGPPKRRHESKTTRHNAV